jgi:hypothetical protein
MRRFGSRCGAICKVVPLIKSKKGRGWRPILPLCQQQLPQLSPQPQLLLPQPQPQLHPQFPELLLQKPPQQHTRMRISTIHRQESPFPLFRHMLLTSL